MGVDIGVGLVPVILNFDIDRILILKKETNHLNKDDFVMFLVDWCLKRSLLSDLLLFWWWNMDVNVFLYYSLATASE